MGRFYSIKRVIRIQTFVFGEFSISKSGRLSNITSIDVKNAFYHLREDLDKLTIASYFLELTTIVTMENVINNTLFDLLFTFLDAIEKSESLDKQHLLKVAFELKLLQVIGLKPELERCVNCGNETEDPKFSVEEGGVICESCYHLYPDNYRIGHVIPRLMHFLLGYSVEQVLETEIDNVLIKKIDYVLYKPANRWKVLETKVIDEKIASDHCPLLTVLELLPER